MPESADKLLWGATVNAHAVEGRDFDSDWWRWEQRPGRIAANATSEAAAGHLERFRDDIRLAAAAGLNALQYAISWARIEPREDTLDEAALAHYQSVFKTLEGAGITPVAVLQEDALPAWFSAVGAWDNPAAPAWFERYVARVFEALHPHCSHWLPHANPILWQRLAFGEGRAPRPARAARGRRAGTTWLGASHVRAWTFLRAQPGRHHVGGSIAAPHLVPSDPHSPWDLHTCRWQQHRLETAYPEALIRTANGEPPFNFLAVALPGWQRVHFAPTRPRKSFAEYEVAPEQRGSADTGTPDAAAIPAILERCRRWDVPVLLTGAGCATEDDTERCAFLLDHTAAVLAARDSGAPLLGFCYRSLLDGFEGARGYSRRYGLIHVDRKTLARTPNPSAFLYHDIAQHNAIRPGAVARYCPGWQETSREAG